MENEKDKLDMLLHKLSKTAPELSDAEMLTENIMQKIKAKDLHRNPILLTWIRAVTSTAAVLLIGLFLFQQNGIETTASATKHTEPAEIRINIDSVCLKSLNSPASNMMALYICHLQQNSLKNKLYKTFDPQLNNKDHELNY